MTHSHTYIERFLDALWMERGLSDNTLAAYRNDLNQFALWLQDNHARDLTSVDRAQLTDFLLKRRALQFER